MSIRQLRGFQVPPLSTVKINRVAINCRKKLFGVDESDSIDLWDLVERFLPEKLGINYDIREVELMKDIEAAVNPDKGELIIREDVYLALTDSSHSAHGRARFTIAHELGHLFLHEGITLNRQVKIKDHKVYEDSEWQADTFASELLMPSLICHGLTIEEIQKKFIVSYAAAQIKFEKLNN
ncbi:ImmA/IrrE family metallo-endopeptidase [Acinetobacter baumannii]|uniref:ImmA/IrrE family metallo-endopeptidase n=1 Tax=Acinetobacter baumannii TaxID=470 RepID=UPI003524D763